MRTLSTAILTALLPTVFATSALAQNPPPAEAHADTAAIRAPVARDHQADASTMRQAFTFTNTLAMLQPEVLVSRAHQKFDRDGRLSDEATRKFLRQYLQTFYDWAIRILHGA
jgi:hypothetical protein